VQQTRKLPADALFLVLHEEQVSPHGHFLVSFTNRVFLLKSNKSPGSPVAVEIS